MIYFAIIYKPKKRIQFSTREQGNYVPFETLLFETLLLGAGIAGPL
jgi:hypothetical protein